MAGILSAQSYLPVRREAIGLRLLGQLNSRFLRYNGRMSQTPLVNPPLPLLITGIAGVAGYNALHFFRHHYPGQVVGIRQQDNWRLVGPGIEVCNAEDLDGLRRLFEKHRFAAVLDCAGNCALKSCELDPEMAWRINVEGVRTLTQVAREFYARLVHLSIDLVYSGASNGGHVEEDPAERISIGLHSANFATNGNQLQRPRGSHRLDSVTL
jgi:dTDP-4-dehydrorhamnose reductase